MNAVTKPALDGNVELPSVDHPIGVDDGAREIKGAVDSHRGNAICDKIYHAAFLTRRRWHDQFLHRPQMPAHATRLGWSATGHVTRLWR